MLEATGLFTGPVIILYLYCSSVKKFACLTASVMIVYFFVSCVVWCDFFS